MAEPTKEKLTRGTVRTEYVPECEPLRARAEAAEADLHANGLYTKEVEVRLAAAQEELESLKTGRPPESRSGYVTGTTHQAVVSYFEARAEAAESLNTRNLSALEALEPGGIDVPGRGRLGVDSFIRDFVREALAPDAGTEDGAVSSEGGTE